MSSFRSQTPTGEIAGTNATHRPPFVHASTSFATQHEQYAATPMRTPSPTPLPSYPQQPRPQHPQYQYPKYPQHPQYPQYAPYHEYSADSTEYPEEKGVPLDGIPCAHAYSHASHSHSYPDPHANRQSHLYPHAHPSSHTYSPSRPHTPVTVAIPPLPHADFCQLDDPSRGLYGTTRRIPLSFGQVRSRVQAAIKLGEVRNKARFGTAWSFDEMRRTAGAWVRWIHEPGLGKWLILGWIATTLGFLVASAWWRGELFHALDDLSENLASQGLRGKAIFASLILLTTIPPLPLYSTLLVLAGYTFGVWHGFVVAYVASLVGAVVVFVASRTFLKDTIGRCLSSSPTSTILLHLLSTHPHLLLLIRIAPYPYNLLNAILAASPVSLRTYTLCTALSLCKLVLHAWIGAGIHSLGETYLHESPSVGDKDPWASPPGHEYGLRPPNDLDEDYDYDHGTGHGHAPGAAYPSRPHWAPHHGPGHAHGPHDRVRVYSTVVGIALCAGLFFYMTYLAKRALRRAHAEQEDMERHAEAEDEDEDGHDVVYMSAHAADQA